MADLTSICGMAWVKAKLLKYRPYIDTVSISENSLNFFLSHSAEDKKSQNSVLNHFVEEKTFGTL
jgi:hypothetical protein